MRQLPSYSPRIKCWSWNLAQIHTSDKDCKAVYPDLQPYELSVFLCPCRAFGPFNIGTSKTDSLRVLRLSGDQPGISVQYCSLAPWSYQIRCAVSCYFARYPKTTFSPCPRQFLLASGLVRLPRGLWSSRDARRQLINRVVLACAVCWSAKRDGGAGGVAFWLCGGPWALHARRPGAGRGRSGGDCSALPPAHRSTRWVPSFTLTSSTSVRWASPDLTVLLAPSAPSRVFFLAVGLEVRAGRLAGRQRLSCAARPSGRALLLEVLSLQPFFFHKTFKRGLSSRVLSLWILVEIQQCFIMLLVPVRV